MYKMRNQVEGQIQEIVFFFSLLLAFSIFIGGIFYLTMSTETLNHILGEYGAILIASMFSVFGYSFFYMAVTSLHMGYVTNFHVFNFKDFKREYHVLLYSLLAHVIISVLFCNFLTVIQLSLQISASSSLPHGAGGLIGSMFGSGLYAALGVYGAVSILAVMAVVTALLAGFFEIPDVIVAFKNLSHNAKTLAAQRLRGAQFSLTSQAQSFFRPQELRATTASTFNTKKISTSLARANSLLKEHLKSLREETKKIEKKTVVKEAKAKTVKKAKALSEKVAEKKATVKKAVAKKTRRK